MSSSHLALRAAPQLLVAALALLAAGRSGAIDGVLEINQACATGPGCFSGDAPGLPVTLNGRGSYRLTSNLGVNNLLGPPGTNLIEIRADDVQLDLNGFTLRCVNTLTGSPCGSGSTIAIWIAANVQRARIRNGTIFGVPGKGIEGLNTNHQVADLLVSQTGGTGISLGASARVERCTVIGAGNAGIRVAGHSTIVDNLVESAVDDGISAGRSSVVRGNNANSNGGAGCDIAGGSLVEGNAAVENSIGFDLLRLAGGLGGGLARRNVASTNSGLGMRMDLQWLFADNVVQHNNGGDGNPQTSGGIEGSGNLCGTNLGCP